MNIVILSRSSELYSTDSLIRAGRRRNHYVRVFDHTYCDIVIEKGRNKVLYNGQEIKRVDAIIPRIGSTVTTHGAAIVRQFQNMGVFSTLDAEALIRTRDKITAMQVLSGNNIGVPKSAISNNYYSNKDMIQEVMPMPVIIKIAKGTHGIGVILAKQSSTAEAIVETLQKTKQRVILQKFIEESKGADVRVFIVDGKIVGVMKRQAKEGEFRSNLHRGASAKVIELTEEEKETAIKAAEVLGLKIAGVDLLQSKNGPLILEVNASPGLEGIETTTGNDIAGEIIKYIERNKR